MTSPPVRPLSRLALPLVALATLGPAAPPARALPPEPVMFSIPPAEPGQDSWFATISPEYRARLIRVEPLELNGTNATVASWGEQRLRLDTSFGRRGIGAIHMQVDALDGVLFGDNGEFGRDPEPTSGVGLASRQVNQSGWRIGLRPGGDPLRTDGYGLVLRGMSPVNVNYLFGELILPVGVLRVGRQPLADGAGVGFNDGRTGRNLWGEASYHESVDRILFGTKISEVFGLMAQGAKYRVDTSLDNGLFMGFVYDFLTNDSLTSTRDDLQGIALQLDYKWKDPKVLGDEWGPIQLTGTAVHRWDEKYGTSILAIPMRLTFSVGDFRFFGEMANISGTSRELSSGLAALTSAPVTDQKIRFTSARVAPSLRFFDQLELRAEWAYASGDSDPRASSPLTIGNWPRDTNLGLMMFKHIVAFQTGRAAAVGVENLRQLDADTFPLGELASDGRVTNVNGFFPQMFYDPFPDLRLKAGVLFAWSAAPVVDPIQTLLRADGETLADDRVNYNGGKPGNYWGTEIDLGVEWRYRNMFWASLEAGLLMPGSALEDENGDAVNAWMLETRFIFRP